MTPYRALALPLQLASLLFVGLSALLLALINGSGPSIAPLTVLANYLLLSWLNKYAFALLDQAAHGGSEAPVASVEMLGPFGDWRAWVHPLLGSGIFLLVSRVSLPVPPLLVVAVALALWPASLAALAISHFAPDAINPVSLARAAIGLAGGYLALLAALAVAAALAAWSTRWGLPRVARFALWELLLLGFYAAVGGAIHQRRLALDFEPRHSPERKAERDQGERRARRQAMLDEAFTATRVRDLPRAAALLQDWLRAGPAALLADDVHAILAQSSRWPEARAFGLAARTVLAHCLATRNLPLALQAAEAALTRLPQFAPDAAEQAAQLAAFARDTGRPRLAQTLADNAAARPPGALPPGAPRGGT